MPNPLIRGIYMEQEQEERTWYCKQAGLCIAAIHGTTEITAEGKRIRNGEKHIHFSPVFGGGKGHMTNGWGTFSTKDPALIAFLEKREAEVGDVVGPEKYKEAMTPAEVREANAKRQIEDQNRLIADLQRQLAAKAAKSTDKSLAGV